MKHHLRRDHPTEAEETSERHAGRPSSSAGPGPGPIPPGRRPRAHSGTHRLLLSRMPVPGATIRAMPGDLEPLPPRVLPTRPGAGPAGLAAELLGRVRAELPIIGELGGREQVLVAAWLTGLRSARTRRAYAGDVAAWLAWLAERDTDVLAAGRVHVDLWAATQLDAGAAASSVRRRLSALSSFYRYCAAHDLISRVPTAGRGPARGGPRLHRHRRPGPGPGPGPGRRRRRRHRRPGAAHRGRGAAAAAQRAARR